MEDLKLTGEQLQALTNALSDAYDVSSLQQMLAFRLDRRLEEITSVKDAMPAIVFHLLRAAQREGWLDNLVRAAVEHNPGNPALKKFVTQHLPNGIPDSTVREALDLSDVVQLLNQRESVHILLSDGIDQSTVIAQLVTLIPRLAVIDFENPVTASRPGFLGEIMRVLGLKATIPTQKPDDLVAFGQQMEKLRDLRLLAVTHFDLFGREERKREYECDLFHAMRYYTMTNKKLGLVLVSRRPFGVLWPLEDPLSHLDIKTIELRPNS